MKNSIKIIIGTFLTLIAIAFTIFVLYKNYENAQIDSEINDNINVNNVDKDANNNQDITDKYTLYLFHGKTCPACLNAKEQIKNDLMEIPNLEIIAYEVWNNDDNSLLMDKVAEKLEVEVNYIPFFVINNYSKIGYNKENILNELNNTNKDIIKEILNENPDLKPVSEKLK